MDSMKLGEVLKKDSVVRLEVQISITLVLIVLIVAAIQERSAAYADILARGHRLPYADQLFLASGFLFLVVVLAQIWLPKRLQGLYLLRQRIGWGRWAIISLPAIAVSWLFVFSEYSLRFDGVYTRLLIYTMVVVFMVWMANQEAGTPLEWRSSMAAMLIFGCIFVFVHAYQVVVDYPFTLSWSEGNRFYDYSVLFGRRLYDYPADQPLKAFIDIGRQSIWGLPFLFADISIRTMRLWSQIVFTLPYIFLGWVFLRQRKVGLIPFLFFGLWTMLFLGQGPIYSPLILAAILVAASRRSPVWLAFLLVGVAGYYARVSRYTWLVAPAMWAVLIAFLEVPDKPRSSKQRWFRAVIMGVGGLVGGYVLPMFAIKEQQMSELGQSLQSVDLDTIGAMVSRQPLLWDRLWPNETYPLGIVFGLLLAVGPLVVLLLYAVLSKRWYLDLWQKLYLGAMNLAFLLVGLVISVKIGGGSNLHNLDMFLIGLVFTTGLFLEQGGTMWLSKPDSLSRPRQLLLLILIIYPATLVMFDVKQRAFPDESIIQEALTVTQEKVDVGKDEGEILFLDHRQLLTFGYIKEVPLVNDYEKKLLMEMAMQSKGSYFEKFYQDLAEHRFSLIITEPLYTGFQEQTYNFGNENNAWVQWVSRPLLCYYEKVVTFPDVHLQILAPKVKSPPEVGLTCPPY